MIAEHREAYKDAMLVKYGITDEYIKSRLYSEGDYSLMVKLHKMWMEDKNKGKQAVFEKDKMLIFQEIDLLDLEGAIIESEFIECRFFNNPNNKAGLKAYNCEFL